MSNSGAPSFVWVSHSGSVTEILGLSSAADSRSISRKPDWNWKNWDSNWLPYWMPAMYILLAVDSDVDSFVCH